MESEIEQMAYSEASKRAAIKYEKEKMKRIILKYKTEDYENVILPAVKKSGLPTATYIKQAIEEKIERDNKKEK